jgi:hypothetical protein
MDLRALLRLARNLGDQGRCLMFTIELTQEQIEWLKYAVANSSQQMWDYTLVNSINEALEKAGA